MLRLYHNKKAQANFAEYAIVFIIIVGMMTGMGVYIRRAIQGKIYDARNTMLKTVFIRTAGYYNNGLYLEYEPYYSNTTSSVVAELSSNMKLLGGGSSGIYRETVDDVTTRESTSTTAPPINAD